MAPSLNITFCSVQVTGAAYALDSPSHSGRLSPYLVASSLSSGKHTPNNVELNSTLRIAEQIHRQAMGGGERKPPRFLYTGRTISTGTAPERAQGGKILGNGLP